VTLEGGGNSNASQLTRQTVSGIQVQTPRTNADRIYQDDIGYEELKMLAQDRSSWHLAIRLKPPHWQNTTENRRSLYTLAALGGRAYWSEIESQRVVVVAWKRRIDRVISQYGEPD